MILKRTNTHYIVSFFSLILSAVVVYKLIHVNNVFAFSDPHVKRNSAPYFATVNLPTGQVGKPYHGEVFVIDIDADPVDLKVFGLPRGLRLTNCRNIPTFAPGTYFGCDVVGIPQNAGQFKLELIASDGKYTIYKIIYLQIRHPVIKYTL